MGEILIRSKLSSFITLGMALLFYHVPSYIPRDMAVQQDFYLFETSETLPLDQECCQ